MSDIDLGKLATYIIALSGWGKILYDYMVSSPKVEGKIFTVITGQSNDFVPGTTHTTFLVYLYLVNKRKNNIHILDYQMEIDFGNGYEKVLRAYGAHKINPHFLSNDNEILIPDFQVKLINKKESPVEFGRPLHGFLVFVGDKNFYKRTPERYKIICRDVFDQQHIVILNKNESENLFLLQDIAGIEIKTKKKNLV